VPDSTKIAKLSLCLVGSTLLGGCSLSLGAAGTRAWSSPISSHIGVTTRGCFALPQEYRYLVGFETSVFGQTSPSISSDQWRAGIVGGYSARPAPTEIFGWEVVGRAQLMRGSQGTFNGVGFVFGGDVGFPFQFKKRDLWNTDDFSSVQQYIVPSVGVNGVVGSHQSIHPEVIVTLSYRFEFTVGAVP
jgi:hypothetical protein